MSRLQYYQSISLTKLPQGLKKIIEQAAIHHLFYVWLEWPPQALTMGEACLAFFLLLKLAFWTPIGRWFIYGNKRQASVDLWLLLNKWGKNDMRAIPQGRLDSSLSCRKVWLQPIPKAAMTHSKL
jgi:hypothetical protein